jgi:hypothetical protein
MPFTKLEQELRLIARERIAKGQLPTAPPSHMWVGHGTGEICALCDKPILADEVEFEAEYGLEASDVGAEPAIRFHLVCESVWKLEYARADYLKKHPGTSG